MENLISTSVVVAQMCQFYNFIANKTPERTEIARIFCEIRLRKAELLSPGVSTVFCSDLIKSEDGSAVVVASIGAFCTFMPSTGAIEVPLSTSVPLFGAASEVISATLVATDSVTRAARLVSAAASVVAASEIVSLASVFSSDLPPEFKALLNK